MKTQVACSVLFVAGFVSVAYAAQWISPWSGTKHTNSSTCTTEPCLRACRVCCVNFHENTTPEYTACVNNCADLPADCSPSQQ